MEDEKFEIYQIAIWIKDANSYYNGGYPYIHYSIPLNEARLFSDQRSASLCLAQGRKQIKYLYQRDPEKLKQELSRLDPPNMELREIKTTIELV